MMKVRQHNIDYICIYIMLVLMASPFYSVFCIAIYLTKQRFHKYEPFFIDLDSIHNKPPSDHSLETHNYDHVRD